jgi:hypothetical protein
LCGKAALGAPAWAKPPTSANAALGTEHLAAYVGTPEAPSGHRETSSLICFDPR